MYILTAVILMMAFPQMVPAATKTWVAPVEREDGTPLSQAETGGFRFYYSNDMTTPGVYQNQIFIDDPLARSVDIPDSGVDREGVATTVDADGRESAFSLPTLIEGVIFPPKPPTWPTVVPPTDRAAPTQ